MRRLLRGRRAPRPDDQEWMRLILLVRKMQRSQLSILHRFDEVRALTAAVSSFRGGFEELDRKLDRASDAFGRMEHGLTEGFAKLEPPELSVEKVAVFDEGVARLEALAQHLGELVSEATEEAPQRAQLATALESVQDLAHVFEGLTARLEKASLAAEESRQGAELATALADVQGLATDFEGLTGRLERVSASAEDSHQQADLAAALSHVQDLALVFEDLTQRLERTSLAAEDSSSADEMGAALANVQALAGVFEDAAERLEQASRPASGPAPQTRELEAAVAHVQSLTGVLEGLAGRLESVAVPQLPPGSSATRAPQIQRPEAGRAGPAAEGPMGGDPADEGQVAQLREALRASELARSELEVQQNQALSEMADHARRRTKLLEDDIKKKKRGMAELTQQNIALQVEVGRLKEQVAELSRPPQRLVPALPAELRQKPSLSPLFDPGEAGRAYAARAPAPADEAAEQGPEDGDPREEPGLQRPEDERPLDSARRKGKKRRRDEDDEG